MDLLVKKEDHLKKLKCKIRNVETKATLYFYNKRFYLIQDRFPGARPNNEDHKKYGLCSWIFSPKSPLDNSVEILSYIEDSNRFETWTY